MHVASENVSFWEIEVEAVLHCACIWLWVERCAGNFDLIFFSKLSPAVWNGR